MQHQVCTICGKKATNKFTKIVNGQVEEQFFCSEHADQNNQYVKKPDMQSVINTMLKNLIENPGGEGELENISLSEVTQARCTNCGLTFANYRKTMMLGCSQCYDAFADLLVPDLQKYHGSSRHTGRSPGIHSSPKNEKLQSMLELRKRMNDSISREDFWEAARLRDQIRALEESEN